MAFPTGSITHHPPQLILPLAGSVFLLKVYPFQIDCVYRNPIFIKCNSDRNRWTKKHLTYDIKVYTSKLSRSEVDHEIARAFKLWENASVLTFTQVTTGQADIVIRYAF